MANFEKIFNDASTAYNNNDLSTASALLNDIIAEKPFFAPAYNMLADIFYQTGNKDEALTLYQKCLELVPKEAFGYIGTSKILCDFQKYDEALNICLKFKPKKNQSSNDLLLNQARALIGLSLNNKAYDILKTFSKDNQDAQTYIAQITAATGKYKKALKMCDKLIANNNKNSLAYLIKARIFQELEHFDDALECYRMVQNIEPDNVQNLIEQSQLLMSLNKDSEALVILKNALESSDYNVETTAQIALLIYNNGYINEAVDMLEKAFYKDPLNSKLNIAIGSILINVSDNIADNCKYFKTAIANNDLNESDIVFIHNTLLSLIDKNLEAVKDIIDFWIEAKPFDSIVLHLKNIIDNRKVSECEFEYLKRIYNQRALYTNKHEMSQETAASYNAVIGLLSQTVFAKKLGNMVLDIGCGSGSLSKTLRPLAPFGNLYGIDISSHMVELCRNQEIYDNLHNIEVTKFLEDTYDYFDLIIADGIFQTKGDLIPYLQSINRALVPNGYFIFTVKVGNNPKEVYKLDKDGLFCHSLTHLKKLLSDFELDILFEKAFSFENYYGQNINSRCFVVRK
ncbi:MAG: methyltransferase domain-containing protein [Alphaproteobacteria bacterium]